MDELRRPEPQKSSVKRIVVLFSRLSGYMASCLKALEERYGVELMVYRIPPQNEAPFAGKHFDWISQLYDKNAYSAEEIRRTVEDFDPQGILMAGWFDKNYLRVARALKKKGVHVVAGSDAQWTGSLRQHVGRIIAPWYLQSAIDVLWIAGEKQRRLAYSLGFKGIRCWSGYYTCDWSRFAIIHHKYPLERPKAFLYVGRYASVKAIDVLIDAYEMYRSTVKEPWPLICAGTGDMKSLLSDRKGIIDKGFIQPDQLPELMGQTSFFVLPSRREPWGVVVHEAAAAGLPTISSDSSGAAVHLVLDQYNGFLFHNEDVHHLAHCLRKATETSSEEWANMSKRSHLLSQQYTPERWADTLVQGLESMRTHDS